MTKRYTDIITDQQAEGSPESGEAREPASPKQSMPIPTVRSPMRRSPAAETGLVPAFVLPGEGSDNSDTQDASRTTGETQTSPTPQSEAQPRVTALIIEDTQELAEIIQVTLQRMKMITAHESHGNRAFARFNELNPDLVLLDIGLPDITGWKLLDILKERQRETGGKMPVVIVITAYGDPANRLVGKLHGVYSYLIKPFTPGEIEQVVKTALNSAAG